MRRSLLLLFAASSTLAHPCVPAIRALRGGRTIFDDAAAEPVYSDDAAALPSSPPSPPPALNAPPSAADAFAAYVDALADFMSIFEQLNERASFNATHKFTDACGTPTYPRGAPHEV